MTDEPTGKLRIEPLTAQMHRFLTGPCQTACSCGWRSGERTTEDDAMDALGEHASETHPWTAKGRPVTYDPKPETPDLLKALHESLAQPKAARLQWQHDMSHRPLAPIPGAIYLTGPMSGVPENNYPAFHAAASKLRAEGHVVLSPAEHAETADSWAGWMRLGIAMLIQCDTIVLLPGWQESRGAKIEAKLAADLGMASYHYPEAPDPDEQRVTRDAGADK